MSIDRREFCRFASVALAAGALGGSVLPLFPNAARAAETVSMTELMAPQPLPDLALGQKTAPVTIVEYASMTCPHCAHFDETAFPQIKKTYIDTGKVYWILREFPLDPLAAAAFMLARCAAEQHGPERYYAMVNTLFHQQSTWAVEKPIPPLMSIAKQAGFTEKSFKECLANQKLLDKIEAERQRAIDKYHVNSTPTFFINGSKVEGAISFEDMSKLIDADLKGK